MRLKPKAGFEIPAGIADAVLPFAAVVSVSTHIAEYTAFREYIIFPVFLMDIVFGLCFLVKAICYPFRRYLLRNNGWLDLLASLPLLSGFFSYGKLFFCPGFFAGVPLSIIIPEAVKSLRFLRLFSLVSEIASGSVYIHKRVSKIIVPAALLFLTCIVAIDISVTTFLSSGRDEYYRKIYELSRGRLELTTERDSRILFHIDNLRVMADGGFEAGPDSYLEKLYGGGWFIEVNFTGQFLDYEGIEMPVKGILADAADLMEHRNIVMLFPSAVYGSFFIFSVFIVIPLFKKDLGIIALASDSFAARDYTLLREEAKKLTEHAGAAEGDNCPDELSLLAGEASRAAEVLELAAYGHTLQNRQQQIFQTGSAGEDVSASLSRLADAVGQIEKNLDRQRLVHESALEKIADASAAKAVRIATSSIGEYILKILRQNRPS